MDENMALFMDKLKELVPFAKEKEQELTPDMISDFFGHMPLTEDQIEKIYDYLESNGIFVDRSNDEPDRRMLDEVEEDIDPNDISVPEGNYFLLFFGPFYSHQFSPSSSANICQSSSSVKFFSLLNSYPAILRSNPHTEI